MLDIDPHKRPGAEELHERFISRGADELPSPPALLESSASPPQTTPEIELNSVNTFDLSQIEEVKTAMYENDLTSI